MTTKEISDRIKTAPPWVIAILVSLLTGSGGVALGYSQKEVEVAASQVRIDTELKNLSARLGEICARVGALDDKIDNVSTSVAEIRGALKARSSP